MAVSATDFEPKFGVCDVEYAHERVMVEKALPNGTKRLEVAEITLPRMDAQAAKKTCDMGHTTHQVKGTDYVTITINGSDLVRDCTYRIGISMYGGGDFKVTVTSGTFLVPGLSWKCLVSLKTPSRVARSILSPPQVSGSTTSGRA